MIRRLARRALKRLVADSPHIPSAPSSGRTRPTQGQAPPPEAPGPEDQEDEVEEPEVEVHAAELSAWLADGKDPLIVDIREPHELWSGAPEGGLLMPMNQVPGRIGELPRDRPVVVVCAAGMRSFGVAHYLREQGIDDAGSLVEGFGGLVAQGFAYHQPPTKAPLRLTQQINLPASLRSELPEGCTTGTVQRLDNVDGTLLCDLQVPLPAGGMEWLRGIPVDRALGQD